MEKNKVTKHSPFRWTIHTEVVIDAPQAVVWSVLTDFEAMPKWSNSLQKIEGDFSQGGKTVVHFLFKGKVRQFRHVIRHFEAGTSFGWSDPVIPLAADNHVYRLEALPGNKTKLVQTDQVKGLTAPLVGKMLTGVMQATYPEFNRKVKELSEKR